MSLLFKQRFWEPIRAGQVTRTYRAWQSPRVRAGVVYRTAAGPLLVTAIRVTGVDEIDTADASAAGFSTVEALRATIGVMPEGRDLYEVVFEVAEAAAEPALGMEAVVSRLARMDAAATGGPWTGATLAAIGAQPGVRAGDLAASVGKERLPFKADVRKLKALGLTESLLVGYRLTELGEAVLVAGAAAPRVD